MPRVEGSLKGDGETRISLYPGEYLSIRYNGAEIERVGNVSDRGSNYTVPSGTTIPKGNYTIGDEIPAGTYKIFFSGTTTSRVRVFQDAQEASNTFNKGKETVLDFTNTEGTSEEAKQHNELVKLRMQVELLRNFLSEAGRRWN